MKLHSDEKKIGVLGITSYLSKLRAIFYKEINGENSSQKLKLLLYTDQTKDSLQKKAYIKIDNETLKMHVSNITVENRTDIDTSTSGIGLDAKVTDVSARNYKIMKGEIYLPNNILSSISTNSQMVIRLYLGDIPVTYLIDKPRMAKLIEFNNIR